MKNKFRYLYSLIGVVTLSVSCSVDRLPETFITDAAYWNTAEDLKQAANYLYTFLPTLPVYDDNYSTDTYANGVDAVSSGNRVVPTTDGTYSANYSLIRYSSTVIEKAPKALANGVSAVEVNRYIAEARFFRAWGHYELVKRYGNVILVTRALPSNAPELTSARNSRDEVFAAIYEDLQFAIENLPWPSADGAANYARVNKSTAYAFLSRVALFAGTWNKFHQRGQFQADLTRAKDAAEALINSGEHQLFQGGYFNLFQYVAEGYANKENIMVRRYGAGQSNSIAGHNMPRSIIGGALINPTKYLIDAYLMKDGLPIEKSPLYQQPDSVMAIFDNRDQRMIESIMKKGDNYSLTASYLYGTNATGYHFRKYVIQEDMNAPLSYMDLTIIRYAEVLLNFAEATFELDGTISDSDLTRSINLLRARGQVAGLTNALAGQYGLDLRNEIRRERRVELAMEGFRYWDLLRWKAAETELVKPVLGIYFFKEEYIEFGYNWEPNLNSQGYVIAEPSTNRTFIPDRDYLWPIPLTEISMNPNLQQNPNWN